VRYWFINFRPQTVVNGGRNVQPKKAERPLTAENHFPNAFSAFKILVVLKVLLVLIIVVIVEIELPVVVKVLVVTLNKAENGGDDGDGDDRRPDNRE
jgi:hypothetical protein